MEAAQTHSSLTPLRSMQHKDAYGNMIEEPDHSNPTRHRWERPLETIRSFNDAVEGGYKRRSMMRTDTEPSINWSRRNSHHPGAAQPRSRPDSFYGSRPVSFRPESTQFSLHQAPAQRAGSMYGMDRFQQEGHHGYGGHPGRQRAPRMHSEPQYGHSGGGHGRGPSGYHLSHQDRSYETVTSAAEGSRHSDQIGYQTDPTSSDNSSIERRSPARRPEPHNDYGIGFSQPQQPQHNLALNQIHGNQQQPPRPPPHGVQSQPAVPRKSVPTVLQRQPTQQSTKTAGGDKRKSWFTRKFSSKKE
ncbi:uncharacterized protein F5Z01DRAFT_148721 [Emericellopsis atlantica]|uniref:Uncharacterized protein n=1 Tax=Emericellopsis atlantica TaxID=2614577 RepID=A0A9P8CP00_9HYPO|nr:uncharacterized protein F5Z01DRAFT_148721 [Emericellopsis atlantica]KAG9253605.1 hypothetical protein F5Z01DRAFT_148721 [Emericellopsis atlantica]